MTKGERSIGAYALVTEPGPGYSYTTGDGHNILAAILSSHDAPPELYRFGIPSGDDEAVLTAFNTPLLKEVAPVTPTEIRYDSFDGTPIQGWVMPPFGGVKEGVKVPTILMIHGGPHGAFGSSWSPRSHVFSGAGYGVIYLNPRGSTGYGQEFTRGCVQDWGGGERFYIEMKSLQ